MTGITGHKCAHCQDTGELGGMGYLNCTNCPAADERTALNATLAALPPVTRDDLTWAAYQAGVALSEERHAREVAELAAMVRKMWGWAIELGQDDLRYFDDPIGSKADWQDDMLAGAALAKKYGK